MDVEERRGVKLLPWQILSGTSLKIGGIILMTADHLHQMFILQGVPTWFYWLGRPVAAIFLFLCAEGFYYTRSKKRYMFQFLIGFLFMSVVNRLLSWYMRLDHVALINNIFGTLLMATFYMSMVDLIREGIREKKRGKIFLALGGMIIPLMVSAALVFALAGENRTLTLILAFIPNPVAVEGGFVLTFLGVSFYILRNYRLAQIGVLLAVSVFAGITAGPGNAQWLMGTALVPILLYNGSRGRGGKYFFYIFYPAHIYLFYLIAWFLSLCQVF